MEKRLLHPKQDDVTEHLREEADSRLVALTRRGERHLNRLRLNRPPLLALRQARREVAFLRNALAKSYQTQKELRSTIESLEKELEDVLQQLVQLLE